MKKQGRVRLSTGWLAKSSTIDVERNAGKTPLEVDTTRNVRHCSHYKDGVCALRSVECKQSCRDYQEKYHLSPSYFVGQSYRGSKKVKKGQQKQSNSTTLHGPNKCGGVYGSYVDIDLSEIRLPKGKRPPSRETEKLRNCRKFFAKRNKVPDRRICVDAAN